MLISFREECNNAMNWKTTGKKIWKRTWQLSIVLFLMLCILEISYRYQWIDFYKLEFRALNKKASVDKPNILVFGDSFTAQPNGYADQLQKEHQNFNVVNCAIPGTGPYEMELIASRRIADFPPKCVIYQMYLGNDLIDISPQTNWSNLSFKRNVYWTSKQYFQIFNLFSRRISGIQTDFDPSKLKQDEEPFSTKSYSPRTKMLIQANPDYVQQSVMSHSNFEKAIASCKASIHYLREIVPKSTPIYIVMIPHFSQVSNEYNERYQQLGASKTSMRANYPLLKEISKIKGVKVLNPITFFREKEKEGVQLYFNNDPHLTENGQTELFYYLNGQLKNFWK